MAAVVPETLAGAPPNDGDSVQQLTDAVPMPVANPDTPRGPTKNMYRALAASYILPSLSCWWVAVSMDTTFTYIGGKDLKIASGLHERCLWVVVGFVYLALGGLCALRWSYVLEHDLVKNLCGSMSVSEEEGHQDAFSRKRRESIRKTRPWRPTAVLALVAVNVFSISLAALFTDQNEATPPLWFLVVAFCVMVMGASCDRMVDPLTEIMEALSQKVWLVGEGLEAREDIDWNLIAREYQTLDALVEAVSSFWELGAIILLCLGSKLLIVVTCTFAILTIDDQVIVPVAALVLMGSTLVVLTDLKQFSEIDKLVNSRHFQSGSIVGNAGKFVGDPCMSDRASLAHLKFLNYTRDNKIGIAPFGLMIDQVLIIGMGKQLCLGLPVLIGALKTVIAKTS